MSSKLVVKGITDYYLVDGQMISAQNLVDLLGKNQAAVYKRNLHTGSYDYLSPVITRLTGYTLQELKNNSFTQMFSLIHPDDVLKVDRLIKQALAGESGADYHIQYRFKHCNGFYLWLDDSFTFLRDADGQADTLIGNVSDISSRVQVEDELRLVNQRMAGILEGIRAATWEWNVQTGELTVNEHWAEIIGYSITELSPISIKTWQAHALPDDLALSNALLQKHFSGELPYYDCEVRMRNKDGHTVWVHDRGRVITWTADGKPLMMFGTHTDISGRKLAETVLLASENRYRMLFENMREGFSLQEIITDENGKVVDFCFLEANKAFERHTGMKPDDVVGRTMLDVMPDANKKQIEAFGVVALTGNPMEFDYYSASFQKYLHVFAYSPQIGRFATTVEDVTDRRLTEIDLKQSKRRLQEMVDTSQYAILLANSAAKIETANPAACTIFGWPNDELIGMDGSGLLDTSAIASINAVAELEQLGKYNGVLPFLKKDGTRFYCESFLAMYREEGEKRYSLICLDISERLRIEEMQRASEQQYHSMFESNTAIKLLVDPENGAIVRANQGAAEFYGWPVQTLEQMKITEINIGSEEDAKLHLNNMLTQKIQYHVFKNRTADGEIRDVEVYSSPLDFNGRKMIFSIIHDVTDRKDAEFALLELQAELENRVNERTEDLIAANLELEKALKVKDEFLSTMSHELRTPLTGIIGLTQAMLLSTQRNYDEKTLKNLQLIEKSGLHLNLIISTILDYTRLMTGKVTMQYQPCMLHSLVNNQIRAIGRMAFEKEIQLSMHITPDDAMIVLDEKRIGQVLNNLLSNAVKFTNRGGNVVVTVVGDKLTKQVSIAVSDNGIGIKETEMERLFQPFMQLDSVLARQYEGIGMGLVMVKLLVEMHYGSVTVFSEPGIGSTFTVTLPWREM